MLAFDDQAFARLMIAATAVPAEERGRWLQDVAYRLGPPRLTAAAQRQERRRRRAERGLVVLPVEVQFVELSERLVEEALIGAWDADNREAVGEALSRIIRRWISHA